MSFAVAEQIVTVTVRHSVDAIGSILSERFLPGSGQHLRFNIDDRNLRAPEAEATQGRDD